MEARRNPHVSTFNAAKSRALDAIEDELAIAERAYEPVVELLRRFTTGRSDMSLPALEAHAALWFWRDKLRTWRAGAEREWEIPA